MRNIPKIFKKFLLLNNTITDIFFKEYTNHIYTWQKYNIQHINYSKIKNTFRFVFSVRVSFFLSEYRLEQGKTKCICTEIITVKSIFVSIYSNIIITDFEHYNKQISYWIYKYYYVSFSKLNLSMKHRRVIQTPRIITLIYYG